MKYTSYQWTCRSAAFSYNVIQWEANISIKSSSSPAQDHLLGN